MATTTVPSGNWTPYQKDINMISSGTYVRTGQVVHVSLDVVALEASKKDVKLTGLPFSVSKKFPSTGLVISSPNESYVCQLKGNEIIVKNALGKDLKYSDLCPTSLAISLGGGKVQVTRHSPLVVGEDVTKKRKGIVTTESPNFLSTFSEGDLFYVKPTNTNKSELIGTVASIEDDYHLTLVAPVEDSLGVVFGLAVEHNYHGSWGRGRYELIASDASEVTHIETVDALTGPLTDAYQSEISLPIEENDPNVSRISLGLVSSHNQNNTGTIAFHTGTIQGFPNAMLIRGVLPSDPSTPYVYPINPDIVSIEVTDMGTGFTITSGIVSSTGVIWSKVLIPGDQSTIIDPQSLQSKYIVITITHLDGSIDKEVIYFTVEGVGDNPLITTATASLQDKYFTISTPTVTYCPWFHVLGTPEGTPEISIGTVPSEGYNAAVNEIQLVNLGGEGINGIITIKFDGKETGNITIVQDPFTTGQNVNSELYSLFGSSVQCTGSGPDGLQIEFMNEYGFSLQALVEVSGTLLDSEGSPSLLPIIVTHSQVGDAGVTVLFNKYFTFNTINNMGFISRVAFTFSKITDFSTIPSTIPGFDAVVNCQLNLNSHTPEELAIRMSEYSDPVGLGFNINPRSEGYGEQGFFITNVNDGPVVDTADGIETSFVSIAFDDTTMGTVVAGSDQLVNINLVSGQVGYNTFYTVGDTVYLRTSTFDLVGTYIGVVKSIESAASLTLVAASQVTIGGLGGLGGLPFAYIGKGSTTTIKPTGFTFSVYQDGSLPIIFSDDQIPLKIDISPYYTANDIAGVTTDCLNNTGAFYTNLNGNMLVVENIELGAATDATAEDTGFTVVTQVQGANAATRLVASGSYITDSTSIPLPPPPPTVYTLSSSPAIAYEGESLVFELVLDIAPTSPVVINYQTREMTAGSNDFTASMGTVTFAIGQTIQSISIPTTADLALESTENMELRVWGSNVKSSITPVGAGITIIGTIINA